MRDDTLCTVSINKGFDSEVQNVKGSKILPSGHVLVWNLGVKSYSGVCWKELFEILHGFSCWGDVIPLRMLKS